MWKLFQQEMGTVILKTCGTARRGKSRRPRFPGDGQGPALSPQHPWAAGGGGQVLTGKHEQTPECVTGKQTTRGQEGQSPAQGGSELDLEKHPGLRSETIFVPGDWKLPKESYFLFLSALYLAIPRAVPPSRNLLKAQVIS